MIGAEYAHGALPSERRPRGEQITSGPPRKEHPVTTAPGRTDTQGLTSNAVLALAHAQGLPLTYRQLDHWTNRGYVRCNERPTLPAPRGRTRKGSGVARTWPVREASIAAAMLRLTMRPFGLRLELAAEIARDGEADRHYLLRNHGASIRVGPETWTI
jgi:hypothetical protein